MKLMPPGEGSLSLIYGGREIKNKLKLTILELIE